MNNKTKKKLISGAVAIALASTLIGNTNVEAKKRNHKPTLSFKGKLKNKKKMTVNVGDKVYVKGKAKDKEDGNITRKIKVKVTKPKNGRYKKKGNYITFKEPGNYKVKLNVKDSDKKSTSLSRTITVKSASLQNTTEAEQEVLPENNTTVTPTEAPVTTPTYVAPSVDLSKYGDIEKVVVDGKTYNYTEKLNIEPNEGLSLSDSSYELNFGNYNNNEINYYINIGLGENSKLNNYNPRDLLFKFFNGVTIKIDGKDYSENLLFCPREKINDNLYDLQILVVDNNNKLCRINIGEITYGKFEDILNMFYCYENPYNDLSYDEDDEIAFIPTPLNKEYDIGTTNINLVLKK